MGTNKTSKTLHEPAGKVMQQLVNTNVFFFWFGLLKFWLGFGLVYKNFGSGYCNRQNVIGHNFFSAVLIGQKCTPGELVTDVARRKKTKGRTIFEFLC